MTDTLTSLADCKAWLGLTTTADDALLGALVGDVSRAILADLGRAAVLPTTYVDTLDGGGAAALALRQWPVTRVLTCLVEGLPLAAASAPGQAGWVLEGVDVAPPGASQRLICRGGTFPREPQSVAVTYRAGYEIIGEQAIVPGAAPFTVAALAPYGTWRVDTGVYGASAPYTTSGGVYTFAAADAGASLTLSYGYVPADLARAALEWVADRYAGRTRIGQSAKTLGGQETASFLVKAMPDVVDRLLRPYRRVAQVLLAPASEGLAEPFMDPDTVLAALLAKAEALRQQLLAKAEANVSGEILQARSGALKASIVAEMIADADAIALTLGSEGVPYAAIQEYGGTTAAHDITPVKAKALAFAGAAGPAFARRVHHPGSRLPARAYLGAARDALEGEFAGGLKAAVLEALGAA